MKKYIFIVFLSVGLTSCCTSNTCMVVRFWDGAYTREKASIEMNRKEKEFYEKELPEQKMLRSRNERLCNQLTKRVYFQKIQVYKNEAVNMSDIYVHCMRVNGSPLYLDFPRKYSWLTDDDVKLK